MAVETFFTSSQQQLFMRQCLKAIQISEPSVFVFGPKTDREWRLRQFLSNNPDLQFEVIHLTYEIVDSIDNLHTLLNAKKTSKQKVIFIMNAEFLINEHLYSFLNSIVDIQINNLP